MLDPTHPHDTGLVRVIRILAGLFAIAGFAAEGWQKYGDGPEVLCAWLGLICFSTAVVFIVAYLIVRSSTRRRHRSGAL
jgi:phage shock protein PspC (stress-responsive transcriptional regulator)